MIFLNITSGFTVGGSPVANGKLLTEKLSKIEWSDNDEINIRAKETMQSMVFDMSAVPPELLDSWFVYKFRVVLPDFLR